jgi:hypothetical protein
MWRSLLEQAVASSSQTRVARELGLSKTTISLVLSGKYRSRTDQVERRVLARYARLDCPYLGRELEIADCETKRTQRPPTSSPSAYEHWVACLTCLHNPARKEVQP